METEENKPEFIAIHTVDELNNFIASNTSKAVMLDFYADWCGPCKMIAPILEQISEEYEGKVDVYKIDTEAEQELAAAFGIRSIPSLLFVPKDEMPQMANGALPKQELERIIAEVLKVNN